MNGYPQGKSIKRILRNTIDRRIRKLGRTFQHMPARRHPWEQRPEKIAICISGQLRTFEACLPSMKKYLIDPLGGDVFVSTWRQVGSSHKEEGKIEDVISSEAIQATCNARAVHIEDFCSSYRDLLCGIRRPEHLAEVEPIASPSALPNFYMIYCSNELKRAAELEDGQLYDLVIRIRPDLLLEQDLSWISKIRCRNKEIWHCDYAIKKEYQVSDKLAFGNSEAMDIYSSLFLHIKAYWDLPIENLGWELMPVGERLMRRYCRDCGLRTKDFSTSCRILRRGTLLSRRDC